MKASLKQKWLEALRSGNYEQAIGLLCQYEMREGQVVPRGYCCLGVLCDVMDPTKWKLDGVRLSSVIYNFYSPENASDNWMQNNATSIPVDICDDLGLNGIKRIECFDEEGFFSHEQEMTIANALMNFNDERGWDFNDIADWIEANVPEEDDSIEETMHQEDC